MSYSIETAIYVTVFFFQAEDGIRDYDVTGVQTCALPIYKVKYRKMHRGSRKGVAQRGNKVSFGSYGLQSLERAWITGTQIEAARVAISRGMKRKGSMWIRIFPQKSVTKKPLEVRIDRKSVVWERV